jgi:hypothetical protein
LCFLSSLFSFIFFTFFIALFFFFSLTVYLIFLLCFFFLVSSFLPNLPVWSLSQTATLFSAFAFSRVAM